MTDFSGTARNQVSADDVAAAVDAAVTALETRLDRDWHVPTGRVEWDCWGTLEHLCTGLLSYATKLVPHRPSFAGGYPFGVVAPRPTGDEVTLFVPDDEGTTGVLRAVNSCGGLVVSLVRTAPPDLLAPHIWGPMADVEGFAAMAVVEISAHLHDVDAALDLRWSPPPDPCARAVARLFPDVPDGDDPVAAMLWATGRGELPGRDDVGPDWRWFAAPR